MAYSKYRLWEIEDDLVSCIYVAEFAWQALRQHDETAGFRWRSQTGINFSKTISLLSAEETSYFGVEHLGDRALPHDATLSDARDEPSFQTRNTDWVAWAVAAFPDAASIRLGRRIGRAIHSADYGDLVPKEECVADRTMRPENYIAYEPGSDV